MHWHCTHMPFNDQRSGSRSKLEASAARRDVHGGGRVHCGVEDGAELIYLRCFQSLEALDFPHPGATVLYYDSEDNDCTAIAWSEGAGGGSDPSHRAKHIDICCFFLHDLGGLRKASLPSSRWRVSTTCPTFPPSPPPTPPLRPPPHHSSPRSESPVPPFLSPSESSHLSLFLSLCSPLPLFFPRRWSLWINKGRQGYVSRAPFGQFKDLSDTSNSSRA